MLDRWIVIAAIAGAGCKSEPTKLEPPPKPEVNTAAPVEVPTPPAGSAAGSATASPQGDTAQAQAFCEKLMHKMLVCFDDAGFWDVLATTYFAKYPDATGNPDAKKAWIGALKDSFVDLKNEQQLAENCSVMVRGLRLPTAADMQAVNESMTKSCTDFGTAMGLLLFHKGVFHMPRS